MSAQDQGHSQPDPAVLKAGVWIRSAGKCECKSSCEHHEEGHCGIALLPEFWSARNILPEWAGKNRYKISMLEALCEGCRLNYRTFHREVD